MVTDFVIRGGVPWLPLKTETLKLSAAARLSDDWGGGRVWVSADEQIAALVEVGAIPYRERYEVRF